MNTVKSLFLTKEYRFLEDGAVSAADKADIILEKVLLSLNFYLFSPQFYQTVKRSDIKWFSIHAAMASEPKGETGK